MTIDTDLARIADLEAQVATLYTHRDAGLAEVNRLRTRLDTAEEALRKAEHLCRAEGPYAATAIRELASRALAPIQPALGPTDPPPTFQPAAKFQAAAGSATSEGVVFAPIQPAPATDNRIGAIWCGHHSAFHRGPCAEMLSDIGDKFNAPAIAVSLCICGLPVGHRSVCAPDPAPAPPPAAQREGPIKLPVRFESVGSPDGGFYMWDAAERYVMGHCDLALIEQIAEALNRCPRA